jgi:hypothetical protein
LFCRLECLMPLPISSEFVPALHQTNVRLRFWLDSLFPDPALPDASPRSATPQQMAGLLSELMRAGQWLQVLPRDRDAALDQELDDYRKNVERLRALLPSIHSTLLGERARLEQERARVEAATEWACRSRQTL